MLQKVGQLVTLTVTALTLVILLVFISQKPDYNSFAKKNDIQTSVSEVEEKIAEKLKGIENVNGLDAINEKYNQLAQENVELRAELEELKKKLNKPKPTPTPTPEKPKPQPPEVIKTEVVHVTVDFLNFRNNPTLDAEIRTTLPNGTKLEVLEKEVIEKDGYKWVKVGLDNGEIGYVAREYVE